MKAALGSGRRFIAAAIAGASLLVLAPGTAPAATINVTTNADVVANDGQCSLRESVTASNLNASNPTDDCTDGDGASLDTIQLAPTATTYTLDKPNFMGSEDGNGSGDLDIEGGSFGGAVRIAGAGVGITTITRMTVVDRLIHVESGSVTIEGVTISGGMSNDGGGIANAGTLTLTNVTVSGNVATGDDVGEGGGGISQFGTGPAMTLNGSTISGNDAGLEGGGVYLEAGTLTLNQSVVSGNSARQGVDDMTTHSPRGGGLHLSIGTTATIDGSSITGNDASTVDPDHDSPNGGGIFNSAASTTITDSTLSGNTTFGGADMGTSRLGGGIFNGGPLTIRNSTISGNNAEERGGGLANSISAAELVHVTFSGNTAPAGAAMDYLDLNPPGGSLQLRGVLIANGASACSFAGGGPPTITSDGYNIDQGNSCALMGTGDLPNVANPMIGGLAPNGGPTQTHALLAGSPAIDRVPNADCDDEDGMPLTVDQRGFGRPSPPGGPCDVGSFEVAQSSPPPPLPGTVSTGQAENAACAALRAKLKKAKSKKKKRKIRKQLRKLGC